MDSESLLKKISIRGRFAFGVKVLEQYTQDNYLIDDWLDRLFETLREFTILKKLDKWDKKIGEFENELKNQSFESNLSCLIENIIQIGTNGLYGGLGEYSSETLTPTLKILEIANKDLTRVPNLKKFEFSKFSEHNGWGKPFDVYKLENVW
ncbi:hypothetical protein G1K66_12645 [Tenacibaculum finnmarkense]|nr:hypothetical protein [Tenacibaculum finnmarkense]MCD8401345.1 hypothetical protein [Tenacibaculum finnmarkense genomovar ulcerans]MCG8237359.1 hypothetical protein [Tenacibaculum finnmarkense genomovar ulcerans]MCG8763333.1 hypothetical protein [Tenacibaculum finnmarkense]MCG8786440.1 hypothetical protein [Tenacibaculum finnmarkense]MCG8788710.1 hypothetical protein [Tenacibaculum finnmarkense]